jgi:hypothetical protein
MQFPVLLAALAVGAGPADDAGHVHHHDHGQHAGGALTWQVDDWRIGAHGFVNAVFDHQGGPRGDEKSFSNSMVMVHGTRPWRTGELELRGMLSLDPAMGAAGYPLLFQTGETANGVTHLIDRQHPHDFFMELGARYRQSFDGGSWFVYAALPGEPALGPPAFMHRVSGMRIPEAPLSHHWLDSTHITMGVATIGAQLGDWTFEASRFNGHEPDQHRWNIETHGFDSTSARVTWTPAPGWSLQVSHGDIKDPEVTQPGVYVRRDTASATYEGLWEGRPWGVTLAYGRNDTRRTRPPTHYHLPAWLLEATAEPLQSHTFFARAERVTHDDAAIPLTFKKASVGYIHDFARTGPVRWGAGGLVSYLRPDPITTFFYGDRPGAYMVFVQARF